jgi:hypothetical protein
LKFGEGRFGEMEGKMWRSRGVRDSLIERKFPEVNKDFGQNPEIVIRWDKLILLALSSTSPSL